MHRKYTFIIFIIIILFSTGFVKISTKPNTVYRVYLKGESLGLINSKKELQTFIDQTQEEIKKE